jgi:hypothetical protein
VGTVKGKPILVGLMRPLVLLNSRTAVSTLFVLHDALKTPIINDQYSSSIPDRKANDVMAEPPALIDFEDLPFDEARREPRMDPEIYTAHTRMLQSLDNAATGMPLPEGTRSTTMKSCILRVAAERSQAATRSHSRVRAERKAVLPSRCRVMAAAGIPWPCPPGLNHWTL